MCTCLYMKIIITIIGISCKFTYENYMTYTHYINLVVAIIGQQKFLLAWK